MRTGKEETRVNSPTRGPAGGRVQGVQARGRGVRVVQRCVIRCISVFTRVHAKRSSPAHSFRPTHSFSSIIRRPIRAKFDAKLIRARRTHGVKPRKWAHQLRHADYELRAKKKNNNNNEQKPEVLQKRSIEKFSRPSSTSFPSVIEAPEVFLFLSLVLEETYPSYHY